MSSDKDAVTSSTTDRFTGRVKWFNNKAGYGFITVTDAGERENSDIFVHHSAIDVYDQQYKYLVQGEYVEFNIIQTTDGSHEFQSSKVGGIKGGKLMCETRHEFKLSRINYKTASSSDDIHEATTDEHDVPKQRAPRTRGDGPRDGTKDKGCEDKKDWNLVKKQEKSTPSGRGRGRPPRSSVSQV